MSPPGAANTTPSKLVRKVAIVTGGASGFGAATARKLAAKGAIVAILDQNEELGEKVVAELVENFSGELDIDFFTFVKTDLSDLKDLKRAFDKVVNKYGTLDIMISNAGLGLGDRAFERCLDAKEPETPDEFGDGTEYAQWLKMHAVNTAAVFYGTQLAINEFRKAAGGKGKKGVIVSTASMAALWPTGNLPVYGAGKAAVLYWTRKLDHMLRPRDGSLPAIRINVVCPAAGLTGMYKEGLADPVWGKMFNRLMDTLKIPVEAVADAIIAAAEDDTMAGEVIRVLPQGIDIWDCDKNEPKRLLAKI
ncbi:hypothetical protein DFJ74DRAFT_658865 [Hyaloraphidium curvatum]|nr:hypothetical protein DFJ74DRAFT_658865 [Hyaloraphidium curvatum]